MISEAKRKTNKEWYERNKEECHAKQKQWREANKEKKKQQDADYYLKNRERELSKGKQWREENKELKSAQDKAYREANKEKIKERRLLKEQSDPLWRRLINVRARANMKGIEFSISKADFSILPTHCPVLGIELNYSNKEQLDNSPSFDRIDPSKGYIPGNVVIISWRANNLKSDGRLDEFLKIIKYIESSNNL